MDAVDILGLSLQNISFESIGYEVKKRPDILNSRNEDETNTNLKFDLGDSLMTSEDCSLGELTSSEGSLRRELGCSLVDLSTESSEMELSESNADDAYEFVVESENEMTYADFKKNSNALITSTPKKLTFGKVEKIVSSNVLITDTSMNNSSFEEEMQKLRDKPYKRRIHQSRMLQKATDSSNIIESMKLARQCNYNCLHRHTLESIKSQRYKYWTKTFENRVNWFLDKVQEGKRSPKDGSLLFCIEGGQRSCPSCFRHLNYISRNFYFKYLKMAKDGLIAYGSRKGRGNGKEKEKARRWLEEYAYFYADKMPDTGDNLLPYRCRRGIVYDLYVSDQTEMMLPSIGKSTFLEMWRIHFPNLKIKQTNSFSKCSTCVSIEKELERTRDQAGRHKLKKMISVHNARQMRERRYYYSKRERAKTQRRQFLSLIIDGMDQAKTNLPHFTGRLKKGIDPNNLLRTHIQGVITHGRGTVATYVDINEYAHDSNLIMNIILRSIYDSIDKNGHLPGVLYIQADNCARENKNRFVLGLCELLVRQKIFCEVHLSFLYVGHTHEDIDAYFSTIAEKLRRNDAETIPKLQLMLGRCRRVQGMFDIKSWLEPHLNKLQHHSKPLHFKFHRNPNDSIMVSYRGNSTRPWILLQRPVLSSIPEGEPAILIPPNFAKIDVSGIRSNIEKFRFQFSGGDVQYHWWLGFLSAIEEIKSSEEKLHEYAQNGAEWIFPYLLNRINSVEADDTSEPKSVTVLAEALDRELEDPVVVSKPNLTRVHGSKGSKQKIKTNEAKKQKR